MKLIHVTTTVMVLMGMLAGGALAHKRVEVSRADVDRAIDTRLTEMLIKLNAKNR